MKSGFFVKGKTAVILPRRTEKTLKTILKSVREYKRATIAAPIFMAGEVALECLIPLMMSRLIDGLGKGMGDIVKYGIILIVMAAGSLTCGSLSARFGARASTGFAKNLRHDLFYKVQSFSFGNVDKFSASGLVTRITTDVTNVQNAYMMTIRMTVRFVLMFVTALTMSFIVSVKMALIFVCVIPVVALGLLIPILKAHPIFERVVKKYDNLNDSIHENIKGMRVVKTYVREKHEKEKFERSAEDIRVNFTRAERIIAISQPIMWFCIFSVMLLLSALGAKLIVDTSALNEAGEVIWGELSTGKLMSLFTYSGQILSSMIMMASVLVQIVLARASAKRISEVLDEESDIVSPENAVTEVPDGSVDFYGVDFKYSSSAERKALDGIELHIKSGETIGVIGGTGSGKTSLVQMIPRLYDASVGTVMVGGKDVREYDVKTLRDSVAMVLQKNTLFTGTIEENLRWGNADATIDEIKHAAHLARADEFIDSFPDGYSTHIEQGGTNVSGGQKQRLTIARALLKNPKILILDDSTSAVDTRTDALIRKAFREEIPNTTKIIIAQRISSVMDADRIVVMNNGQIASVGTHEELLKSSDIYREVYDSQVKGGDDDAA